MDGEVRRVPENHARVRRTREPKPRSQETKQKQIITKPGAAVQATSAHPSSHHKAAVTKLQLLLLLLQLLVLAGHVPNFKRIALRSMMIIIINTHHQQPPSERAMERPRGEAICNASSQPHGGRHMLLLDVDGTRHGELVSWGGGGVKSERGSLSPRCTTRWHGAHRFLSTAATTTTVETWPVTGALRAHRLTRGGEARGLRSSSSNRVGRVNSLVPLKLCHFRVVASSAHFVISSF